MNRIRNEIRRAHRHPAPVALERDGKTTDLSPLEALIGKETVEAYELAMGHLAPREREAIIGRVELDLSYNELADVLGRPSPDAARMAVGRALLKLAKLMNTEG